MSGFVKSLSLSLSNRLLSLADTFFRSWDPLRSLLVFGSAAAVGIARRLKFGLGLTDFRRSSMGEPESIWSTAMWMVVCGIGPGPESRSTVGGGGVVIGCLAPGGSS